MKNVLIICGPTGSGKSSLSIACANKLGTEIVSADSVSIYKGLNIGSAKPTAAERAQVKHHLIDIVSPSDSFSVIDYKNLARPIVENMLSLNKVPIICGGTGLYINSLLFELDYGNAAADPNLRFRYQQLLAEYGKEFLHNILNGIDPESAAKISVNDTKRVIRAIEIFETTGKTKSSIVNDFKPNYNYKAYLINYERDVLYQRINQRVDLMLDAGLVNEVQNLLDSGVPENSQAMQSIGYKEVLLFLNKQVNHNTMSDIIKKNTRNYAKRQLTFFKRYNNLTYLNPTDSDGVENLADIVLNNFKCQ